MKYLLSSAALVLFIGFNSFAQAPATPAATPADPNGPKIEFVQEVIDYGTIQQYADGVRFFEIKNTGKKDLVIQSATGSCGCTVPTKPEEPIKPGKTAKMQVKYATERIGQFTKTVTVVSNAADRPSVTLTIKGNVLKKEDGGAPVSTPGTAPTVAPDKK